MKLAPLLSLVGVFALFCVASPTPSSDTNDLTIVNLRIEGLTHTIFEAPIVTTGHNITTPSGGTHECDGLNDGANLTPGPTCTSALDDASLHQKIFQYDGTFDTGSDDYSITSIANNTQTATQLWGLLLDFQFTSVGGCRQEVKQGQHILWAFDASNKVHFLKATGPITTQIGKPTVYTVVDGSTGLPVAGAQIGGATTDSNGNATLTFNKLGIQILKAEEPSSIRSNAVITYVL